MLRDAHELQDGKPCVRGLCLGVVGLCRAPLLCCVLWMQDPSSLAGLSLATIQLAAAGNALMVPRALYIRDRIWLVGALWGSLVFGWTQMLSMWMGSCPATGARYLSTSVFATASLLQWGWFGGVLWVDARTRCGAERAAEQAAPSGE